VGTAGGGGRGEGGADTETVDPVPLDSSICVLAVEDV
jgi:hypothetical protein